MAFANRLPIAKGASYKSNMQGTNRRCLPNTRTDILQTIQDWATREDGKPVFWLSGMAGTGKSTIIRTMAHLLDERDQLGASFFFRRGEGERGNTLRFFSTIATQLAHRVPEMHHGIQETLDKEADIINAPLEEQFEKLVCGPLSNMGPAQRQPRTLILAIDALDECEQNDNIDTIVDLFARTRDVKAISLRVIVASRPDLLVRLGFDKIDGYYQVEKLHEVSKNSIEHDIRRFFQHELGVIQVKRLLPRGWLREDQVAALVRLAVPLFIYADTACRYIDTNGGDPDEYLERVLNYRKSNISQLERTYLPILDLLLVEKDEGDREEWLSTFRVVVGSIVILGRPLAAVSLAKLLQISQTKAKCVLDSLRSVFTFPTDGDCPVRLLHASFGDFLTDPGRRGKSPFWINKPEMHARIAALCIENLSGDHGLRQDLCSLVKPGTRRDTIRDGLVRQTLPPEFAYAIRYWAFHLEQSQQRIKDGDSTHLFLRNHFLHWLEAMTLLGHIFESVAVIDSLSHIVDVSFLGFKRLLY